MEIACGKAHGLELLSPENSDAVRPTSVRTRRAFFDSLGSLDGICFADLFAGTGAMGLEAASRGAVHIVFAEQSPAVAKLIRKNCTRISKACPDTTFDYITGTLSASAGLFRRCPAPDIVFADPPYAESMTLFQSLTADKRFQEWASHAIVFWELPDRPVSLMPPDPFWEITEIKPFGGTNFLKIIKKK